MLDPLVHPNVLSLSHEGLADAMVGAEWAAPKVGTPRSSDGRGDGEEKEAEFYVDENGDLQDAKPAAGNVDEDDTARPSVGDTAEWGAAYSLADLENAESHYVEAASVRGLELFAESADDMGGRAALGMRDKHAGRDRSGWGGRRDEDEVALAAVSRRLRCKAGMSPRCLCARACVRACTRACVHACVRACVRRAHEARHNAP